jgi:hypothetical protein
MAGVAGPPPKRSGLIVAASGSSRRHPGEAQSGDDAERAPRIVHRHSPDIAEIRDLSPGIAATELQSHFNRGARLPGRPDRTIGKTPPVIVPLLASAP